MRLHFLTRDLRQDYPRIGWLPPLPVGTDQFWTQFSNLHAGEFPEILVSQHNGEWKLYLSAIDSGRTDSPTGGGRIIRISLFLTGTVGDSDGVLELISQFLHETLAKTDYKPLLKEFFQSRIKPGDPAKWVDAQMGEKEKIAADLLENLSSKLPPVKIPSVDLPRRWKSGCCSPAALTWFKYFCQELLSGRIEGMGISLANLSYESSEVKRVLDKLRSTDHAAILLSTESDKAAQIKSVLCPTNNSPMPPPSKGETSPKTPIWQDRSTIAIAIVIMALMIIVLYSILSEKDGEKKKITTPDAKVEAQTPQKVDSAKR